MARIGSFVEELGGDDQERRILISCRTSVGSNSSDIDYLWNGDRSVGRLRSTLARLGRRLARSNTAEDGDGPVLNYPGLSHLIEEYYYIQQTINNYGGGDIGFIASPFCHFIVCGANLPAQSQANAANLKQRFGDFFGHWAACKQDPGIGFYSSSECVGHGSDADRVRIFFGYGIYVPKDNEEPIAELEIASIDEENWEVLRLIEGRSQYSGRDQRPAAAFYPGQLGVAFGYSPAIAPAFLREHGIPGGYLFYLGRLSEIDTPKLRAIPLDRRGRQTGERSTPNIQIRGGRAVTTEGQELVVENRSSGEAYFRLRWRRLQQNDQLLPTPPAGRPCLRLDSLMLPECTRWSGIEHWWLDVDEHGELANGPLGGRSYSLTNSREGARLYRYAEMEYSYKEGRELGLDIRAGSLFRWTTVDASSRWRWRLCRSNVPRAFGFLELPEEVGGEQGILFAGETVARFRTVKPTWFAGCSGVAVSGRRHKSATLELADWAFEGGHIKLRVGGNGRLLVEPSADDLAAVFVGSSDGVDISSGIGGRIEPMHKGQVYELESGNGLVLGCFLFYPSGMRGYLE